MARAKKRDWLNFGIYKKIQWILYFILIIRKPTPRGVRDIGAWFIAFSLTSVFSVMTNCALLAMDKDLQSFAPDVSSTNWVLVFVAIEHIFLCIRYDL